ncbi:hypothetical protein GCM10025777_56280 [Membranihabitans marinus]
MVIGPLELSPLPLAPVEEGGTGQLSFWVGENSTIDAPPGEVPGYLTLSLSNLDLIDPNNVEASVSGHSPYYSVERIVTPDSVYLLFTQIATFPGFSNIFIYIDTKVTGNSPPNNRSNGGKLLIYPGTGQKNLVREASFYSYTTEPAPVELTNFQVAKENQSSLITWSTFSELNSSFFEVQRSTNGIVFETIGTVDAAGNSPDQIEYSFTDSNPKRGINYYRLNMVDLDATSVFSEIKFLNFATSFFNREVPITVFPNPASQFIRLLSNEELEGHTVSLLNLRGSVLKTLPYSSGMTIDLDGVYGPAFIVLVYNAERRIVTREIIFNN